MRHFQKNLDDALKSHKKGSIFSFPVWGGDDITVPDIKVFVSRMQSEMDDPISINLLCDNRLDEGVFEVMEEFVVQNATKVQCLWIPAPEPNKAENATRMVRSYSLAPKIVVGSSSSSSSSSLKRLYLSVSNESNAQPILEACENGSIEHLDIRFPRGTILETPQVRRLCGQISCAVGSSHSFPLKALSIFHTTTQFNDEGMELFVDLFLRMGRESSLQDASLANHGGLTAASLPRVTRLLRGITIPGRFMLELSGSRRLFAEAPPDAVEDFISALQGCSPLFFLHLGPVRIGPDLVVRLVQATEKIQKRSPPQQQEAVGDGPAIFFSDFKVLTKEVLVQLAKSLSHISGLDALGLMECLNTDDEDDDEDDYEGRKALIKENIMTITQALRQNTTLTSLSLDHETSSIMYPHPQEEMVIKSVLQRNKYLQLLNIAAIAAENAAVQRRATTTEQSVPEKDNKNRDKKEFPDGLWAHAMAKVSEERLDDSDDELSSLSPSLASIRADPLFMILHHVDHLFSSSSLSSIKRKQEQQEQPAAAPPTPS